MRERAAFPFAAGLVVILAAACSTSSGDLEQNGTGTLPGASPGDHPSPAAGDAGGPLGDGNGRAPGEGAEDAGDIEPPPAPYVAYDINHVLSTGQSNSVANGGTPVLSTTQPYDNLMFDSGVMPASSCDGEGCRVYQKPNAFVPLVEGDVFFYPVETMSAGLANATSKLARDRFAGKDQARHAMLVTLHGRSGNTYGCLRKGGCNYKPGYVKPFDQAILEIQDAKAIAQAMGKSYVVRAVTAIHGESDHYSYSVDKQEFPMDGTDGTPKAVATYADGMIEWQKDYESTVRSITGQQEPVPLLMLQMSNWNDVPYSRVAMWQLEAHVRAPGKVVVVTPGYPLGYAKDCLHYTAEGQRRLGAYFAKAYARIVLEGRRWEPVRPKQVTASGATITARFHVPAPPLVLDTERVKDPGHYGFEVVDAAGNLLPIANVALAGPDVVTVTLASAVPAGAHLRYAATATPQSCPGPDVGPRGNLRDSDATTSPSGDELFDWSVHFDVPVE